jgi:undecaprenyl-diphosphatase
LDHEVAARFSFWTATPIILGAGVLEAPKLLHHGGGGFSSVAILAGVVAGVVAFLSTALIMRWFRVREAGAFDPFAIYCAVAGVGALAWLILGR